MDKKNEFFSTMNNFPQKGFLMGKISQLKLEPEAYRYLFLPTVTLIPKK